MTTTLITGAQNDVTHDVSVARALETIAEAEENPRDVLHVATALRDGPSGSFVDEKGALAW